MIDFEGLAKSFVSGGGVWAYLTIFVTTFIEGIFPPIPSDVVVLFCALLVSRGELHWLPSFLSAFIGGSLGALVVYWFGAAHGRSYFLSKPRLFVTPERFLASEAIFKRYGNLILALNRTLVGGRSFGFLAAGLTHHRLRHVLAYGISGVFVWYLLLFLLGLKFGALASQLVTGIVMVVMAVLLLSLASIIVSKFLISRWKG